MPNQTVNLHPSKTYDVAASAVDADGNAIALTNLDFTPNDSAVGTDVEDTDPNDANDGLETSDEVGATATLTFTADGPDGKKFEAVADVTIVAEDVPEAMTLTFTERAP